MSPVGQSFSHSPIHTTIQIPGFTFLDMQVIVDSIKLYIVHLFFYFCGFQKYPTMFGSNQQTSQWPSPPSCHHWLQLCRGAWSEVCDHHVTLSPLARSLHHPRMKKILKMTRVVFKAPDWVHIPASCPIIAVLVVSQELNYRAEQADFSICTL